MKESRTKTEKHIKYAEESLEKVQNKVKLYQRDLITYKKAITTIDTQIEIKNFNLREVKNKLENKLLNDSVEEIFNVVIKKEKIL